MALYKHSRLRFFIFFKLTDGKVRFKVDSSLVKKNALLPSFPTGRRLRIEADVIEKFIIFFIKDIPMASQLKVML